MAVKSIKVKLKLGEYPEIRAGLWRLHEAANAGVRYYTEWLSLLRQESLYKRGADGKQECYKTGDDCKRELLQRLRDRQIKNEHTGLKGSDEELLGISRQLYEVLIPQSIKGNGQAQQLASNFLSPLADKNSKGGRGEAKSGRKPQWEKLREVGDPRWEQVRAEYDKKKAADPTKHLILTLEQYGLLPLFDVYTETQGVKIQWKPLGKGQGVRSWDRDMFQQSLERLMSWESWNQRVGEEYARLILQRDRFQEKNFIEQEELVQLAQQLEMEMKAASFGFESDSTSAHQVTKRALRGEERIFEKWLKLPEDAPFAAYDEVIKKTQAQNNRKFGSHDLFAKLAEPQYRPLWRLDDTFMNRYAAFNSLRRKLDNAKQFATFTLPAATANPIWTRFENAVGKNIHTYEFLFDHFGLGRHAIRFDKMPILDGDVIKEIDDVVVPIASSGQVDKLRSVVDASSKVQITLTDHAAPDIFYGEFGGAKIQYDRTILDRLARRDLRKQGAASRLPIGRTGVVPNPVRLQKPSVEPGDVYLNFSVRVMNQSDVRGERTPLYARLFHIHDTTNRVTVRYDRLEAYLQAHPDQHVSGSKGLLSGLRVMSVDLGLRTSASISVFRVATRDELATDSLGNIPFFYPIHGTENLVAIHERSHLIKMPGETETKLIRQIREHRLELLNQLRSQLASLRILVRCGTGDARVQARNWERLIEGGHDTLARTTSEWQAFFNSELDELKSSYGSVKDDDWTKRVQTSVHALWNLMGKQVSVWRKEMKNSLNKVKVNGYIRDAVGGNSIRQIEYLERQYRFLKSWSFFAKASGQVNRAERDSRFAVGLRKHIDHAKEDRLKKLADRIIMEALGYVYETKGQGKGTWQSKYSPCQLILLEELSEYRFSNDRPPSENSQLMTWSHRGVLQELKNQAQMHDVLIGTMYAAFSSRLDARTGIPGVRCRRVPRRVAEGEEEGLPVWLARYLEEHKLDRAQLQAEDLVPTGDGEVFVSPASDDFSKFRHIHADINAAQNLQRRLWTSFDISDIRVRCDRATRSDEAVFTPRLTSKRAQKLYKGVVFVKRGDITFEQSQRGTKRLNIDDTDIEFAEEEMESLLDMDDAGEKSVVLVRDPSGIINHGNWTTQREFWGIVNRKVESYALDIIRSRGLQVREA